MQLNYPPPFVGRDAEFAILKHKVEDTLAGNGSTVFIGGESGVGKTRLAEEIIAHAVKTNFQCFRAQCVPESTTPFMPVLEILKDAQLEHLILQEKPPKLESIYLVTEGGIVIAKCERRETIDADIFMGMVTAVKTFITDSISKIRKSGEIADDIEVLTHGAFNIVNVPGKTLNLIAITTGRENEYLISDMKELIKEIETNYASKEKWDKDENIISTIEQKINALITDGKYEGIEYTADTKIRQTNIFENILRALKRKSENAPVLIFVDDLQWIDTSSLALLHYLARNIRKNKILILGTYRIEDILPKPDGTQHPLANAMQIMNREGLLDKLELKRFDVQSCALLMSKMLGTDVSQEFVEEIYKQTEGNAFFVLETLINLYQENILRYENGSWNLDIRSLKIPSRVYDVIIQRIQRLGREERKILDAASVIGESFSAELLSKVRETPKLQVLEMLAVIEREYKMVCHSKDKYRFEHSKIREVLYRELPEELKVAYHEKVAMILEEDYKNGKTVNLQELVHHFYVTGINQKVVEYGLIAGAEARDRFANDEAVELYKTVLSALGEQISDQKIRVWNEIADVLELQGRYVEAIEYLKNVIVHGGDTERARAHCRCADIYIKKGDYDRAMEEIQAGFELASGVELAKLWSAEAIIHERKGEHEQAIALRKKALEIFTDEKDIANAVNGIGINFLNKGEYDKALEYFFRSLEIRNRIRDVRGIASSTNNIALVYYERGDYDKAIKYHEESLRASAKAGDVRGMSIAYNNIGLVYSERGAYELALSCYKKSLELKEKIADLWGISSTYNNMGHVYCEKGDYETALEYNQKSLDMQEKIGDVKGVANSYTNFGIIYYEMGKYEKAIEYCQKALTISEKVGLPFLQTTAYLFSAKSYFETGEIDACIKALEPGKSSAIQHGLKIHEAIAYSIEGKILNLQHEIEKAMECYRHALDIFEERGQKDGYYYRILYDYAKITNDRALLCEVLQWFEQIGNTHWIAKIKRDLTEMDSTTVPSQN